LRRKIPGDQAGKSNETSKTGEKFEPAFPERPEGNSSQTGRNHQKDQVTERSNPGEQLPDGRAVVVEDAETTPLATEDQRFVVNSRQM